jgi:hypothetical protein
MTFIHAPRKAPVDSIVDKYGFLIAAVVGITSIVLLKMLNVGQILVTGAPLLVMGAYAVVVLVSRRFQLREDQSGDNLYYLGFLYTLTSLSLALWQGLGEPAKIIGDFGIALATTIAGLMLRVFFNQMRVDQTEIEATARIQLTKAAGSLRSELDSAVLDLNHFRRATQQSLADGLTDLSKVATDQMLEVARKFEAAIVTTTEGLGATLVAVGDHTNRLNSTSVRLIDEIEAIIGRLRAMEVPSNLFTDKLSEAFDGLKAASDDVKGRVSSEEKTIKKLIKAVELANTNTDLWTSKITVLVELMERAQQHLTASVEATTKVTTAHQRLVDEMAQLKDGAAQLSLEELSAALGGTVASVMKHNADLEKELATTRGYTQKVAATLVDLGEEIVRRLSDEDLNRVDVPG